MKKNYVFLLISFCFAFTINSQTFLLQESFEGATFPPVGWSIPVSGSTVADEWTYGPQSGLLANICVPHGTKALCSQWASFYPNDTWAFTPGLSLNAGSTYSVTFKQCVQSPSSNKTESFKLTVGSQASSNNQTTTLLDLPTLTNTSPQTRAAVFTPTISGIYYFGFNCYSAANQRYLSIDSINIYTNAVVSNFPSPYCTATFPQAVEPITLVDFAGINNSSSATIGGLQHEDYTALTGTVQTNTNPVIILKGNTNGNNSSYFKAYIDWNKNSIFDPSEEYNLGSISNSTGTDGVVLTTSISIPANAILGNTRLRIVKSSNTTSLTACNMSDAGQAEDYNLLVTGVTSVSVNTQGSVPAYITTNGGTLQMISTVYPLSMSQAVNWHIVAGSGNAGINATGLVTAIANGNVWAKAVSVADPTKKDSMQITIINQVVAPMSIDVQTLNNVPATIIIDNGTLQMEALITPSNASQASIWSIIAVSGNASVNSTGLVTAIDNGTVWAKARAQANQNLRDSMLITITNQTAVGIAENKFEGSLNIFPNPVKDQITLQNNQKHGALWLSIFNVTGEIVAKEFVKENAFNHHYTINTSILNKGIYFIELRSKDLFISRKFIKE